MPLLSDDTLRLTPNDIARFKASFVIDKETGCWNWTRCKNGDGYAVLSINGRQYRASRVAYTIFKGQIPAYLLVCHTCDRPICVNPDHLFLGTPLDNVRDMVRKGRNVLPPKATPETVARGHRHYKTLLTLDQVAEIRERVSKGQIVLQIAAEMNLKYSQVYPVVRGRTWTK